VDTLYKWDYTDNKCLVDLTKDIIALDTVTPDFTFVQTNSIVEFTNTSSFGDSLWWDLGNDSIVNNIDTLTHVYDTLGTYDVWLHVINECTEDSIMYQVITDDLGIKSTPKNNLLIYPNPANISITITNLNKNSIVKIYNILGELVYSEIYLDQQINISKFSNGTYIIMVHSESGIATEKLYVKH
jgi:hypothetical protein